MKEGTCLVSLTDSVLHVRQVFFFFFIKRISEEEEERGLFSVVYLRS